MEGKKYLKWYYKVGYGSGEIAGNVVDAFLSAFVMVYLTTVIGMDTRMILIVVTLIMSKLDVEKANKELKAAKQIKIERDKRGRFYRSLFAASL